MAYFELENRISRYDFSSLYIYSVRREVESIAVYFAQFFAICLIVYIKVKRSIGFQPLKKRG